jgi:hypothetical protein
VFAGHQFAEPSHRILEFDVLAFQSGELRRHEERLREELLNLA